MVLCISVISSGCQSVSARRPWFRDPIHTASERLATSADRSTVVANELQREGLKKLSEHDPEAAQRQLEARLGPDNRAEDLVTLSEISLRLGRRAGVANREPAMAHLRDSAVYASAALALPSGTPRLAELAIALHDEALKSLIRLIDQTSSQTRRSWNEIAAGIGLQPTGETDFHDPSRFTRIELVSSYHVTGMKRHYHNDGFGVPLVALRPVDRDHPKTPDDHLFPRRLRIATTAIIAPPKGGLDRNWRSGSVELAFLDPFGRGSLETGSRLVPIATDRTTPLAVQVAQGKLAVVAWTGLFQASRAESGAGLYSLRPYQPGKIPVVLVHGLFSSPEAWIQTINTLQNDPNLDAKYQIWFFLYPTGNIVPLSAAKLRQALTDAVETFDPEHKDPAISKMVLIGHSMGGLLSRMMVQDTGNELWNRILTVPPDRLEASAKTERMLRTALIYNHLPFVSRVIFVATPHRGSKVSNALLGRIVATFVQPESDLKQLGEELVARYGREITTADLKNRAFTSLGNLRYHSPILMAVDAIPVNPSIPYHSIIMQIPGLQTDGVVTRDSSELKGAVSEVTLPGTHLDQEKPCVTEEIKNILREHAGISSKTTPVVLSDALPEMTP
jgi:pimeloyl-ACP methyl ester carboxylesterase